jgi:hypothetical protein
LTTMEQLLKEKKLRDLEEAKLAAAIESKERRPPPAPYDPRRRLAELVTVELPAALRADDIVRIRTLATRLHVAAAAELELRP